MIRVKIENTNLPCENTKIDIWYIVICGIVDNLEQCGRQNIAQYGFHQTKTGCSFFVVAALVWNTSLCVTKQAEEHA